LRRLRRTYTFDANNATAPPVTLLANGLVRPGLDENLAAHVRNKIVYADIPALNPHHTANTNDAPMTQFFAMSLQDRLQEAAQHQAWRVEDRAPKLLSQSDPELVDPHACPRSGQ
jgi:hypothetical protein